jgi:uncharacterized protein (DUF433 family)
MSTVTTTHVDLDENGVAWVDDTNVKVIEIVIDKLAHGSSPEEMHFQFPHLSLAQIHAALAFYYDHQTELDAEIERRRRGAGELSQEVSNSPLRQKLLASKRAREKSKPGPVSYRRSEGHDTWHWCRNCSSWPASNYEEKKNSRRPRAAELCNECSAKQQTGSCS